MHMSIVCASFVSACIRFLKRGGGGVGPSGGVGFVLADFYFGPALLDLGSCGRKGLGEVALCHGEGCASMANVHDHEIHLSPQRFESCDEKGVLGGLLLKPRVASEVPVESDIDEDEVALLVVESVRVRRRGVWDSFVVDEVGGRSMYRSE